MAAAGIALLGEVLKPGFMGNVLEMGKLLCEGLRGLSKKHNLGEVRGKGLLQALDLPNSNSNMLVEMARENGLLINASRSNPLRFMPALNVSKHEIETCLAILDDVISTEDFNGIPGE